MFYSFSEGSTPVVGLRKRGAKRPPFTLFLLAFCVLMANWTVFRALFRVKLLLSPKAEALLLLWEGGLAGLATTGMPCQHAGI